MKWHWHLDLTEKQFQRLKEGLKSSFRFHLVLAKETVEYNKEKKEFTVIVPKDKLDTRAEISSYINGFYQAI